MLKIFFSNGCYGNVSEMKLKFIRERKMRGVCLIPLKLFFISFNNINTIKIHFDETHPEKNIKKNWDVKNELQ